MSDDCPSNADLEKYVKDLPLQQIEKLPNNVERHRAEEHIKIAYDLATQSREKKADR